MAFGIYIHIPYCLSKCRYCDFHSSGGNGQVPDTYIQAVLHHLKEQNFPQPDTLYFGGGTPSLLTPQQLACIIDAVQPVCGAEITLEANPETLSLSLLQGFRKAGANRLSLGIQTALDDSLKTLGRPHTTAQSRAAFRMAQQAGFSNISGDIMLALPNYTTEEFDQTLSLMVEEGASHISAYLLKIEPGTPFFQNPPANLPDEDAAADFYLYAVEKLALAGYQQYEISNFSKAGYESRHNLLYWNCEDYLGIGPGAHSCIKGIRYAFPRDTHGFIAGTAPFSVTGECTWQDYFMLQLRLNTGLHLPLLQQNYGITLSPAQIQFIQQCQKHNLLHFDGQTIQLTPQGMLVQNSILVQLLS